VTPDRRTLLALFSLAFGLRVLFAAWFGTNPEIVPVHETYDFQVAQRMSVDFGWVTTPFSPNAPGYLLLLAAAFKIAGASWWTAVLLNAFLGATTTLFLYRIGERRLGRLVGLVSALWLGVSVRHLSFASLVIRDVTTTFLLVWFVYELIRPFHRMRVSLWAAFVCMLLLHTEPMFLVLLPVVLVYLAIWSTHHRELSARYLLLFVTALLVFSIPWTARNYYLHRDFIPVSLEARRYTAPLAHLLRPAPPVSPVAETDVVIHAPGFVHNTVEFWRVVRLKDAPADPAHGLGPQPAWSRRHNVISVLNYGVLLPFLVVGALIGWRRRHPTVLGLTGTILSYAILRGFLGANDSTRLLVEPFIILVALYGVKELLALRSRAGAEAGPA
jgi:4-amino-4-deoxy-L-arabinose transferase-like glycosyltransferase